MTTKLLYKKIYSQSLNVIYSIITPIYNQENIIVENLKSIINNTKEAFEIILILDFCFDKTEQKILDFLNNYNNDIENFIQITIFKNETKPLFETKCDNIGFKNSIGIYCIEIQADMKMTEEGYNLHLTKPFKILDNVISVSGRCAHNIFNGHYGIGKLGTDITKTVSELKLNKNKFYIFESCNRGPLIIDKKKLEELNFLNEDDYFLDDSDHDLMIRAFIEKGYICGYVPIDFEAPLNWGSTRNDNTYNNCKEFIINKNEKNMLYNKFKNALGLSKYKPHWKCRPPRVVNI
jgi:glycosyltransferase involved in cell wall biosynthesis